jgi:hypothetical protein
MDVKQSREMAGRYPRKAADDPHHQPLRTRYPQRCFHPLRGALKRVIDLPEEAHEV